MFQSSVIFLSCIITGREIARACKTASSRPVLHHVQKVAGSANLQATLHSLCSTTVQYLEPTASGGGRNPNPCAVSHRPPTPKSKFYPHTKSTHKELVTAAHGFIPSLAAAAKHALTQVRDDDGDGDENNLTDKVGSKEKSPAATEACWIDAHTASRDERRRRGRAIRRQSLLAAGNDRLLRRSRVPHRTSVRAA